MNAWEIGIASYVAFVILFIYVWSKLPRNWDERYPIVEKERSNVPPVIGSKRFWRYALLILRERYRPPD